MDPPIMASVKKWQSTLVIINPCTRWVPGSNVTIEGLSLSENGWVQDGSNILVQNGSKSD